MARAANTGSSFMLNMMIRAEASRARRRRASSNPETVGRLMSSTQISGCRSPNTRSPLSASEASSMSISGSSANRARHPEATMRWSSTIRTRIGIGPEYPRHPVAAPHQVRTPAPMSERYLPSMVMQPERCCCTLRLDRRLFYLSTLPAMRNRRRLRSQTKAISLLDKGYVAKIFVARPDQLAARARPHTRSGDQYCAACA